MFCRKCGNKIDDDSVFCVVCGEKVAGTKITDNVNNHSSSAFGNSAALKRSISKNKKIILSVAAGLVLLLLIYILAMCIKTSNAKKEEEEKLSDIRRSNRKAETVYNAVSNELYYLDEDLGDFSFKCYLNEILSDPWDQDLTMEQSDFKDEVKEYLQNNYDNLDGDIYVEIQGYTVIRVVYCYNSAGQYPDAPSTVEESEMIHEEYFE